MNYFTFVRTTWCGIVDEFIIAMIILGSFGKVKRMELIKYEDIL
jgi:hypothetical protein